MKLIIKNRKGKEFIVLYDKVDKQLIDKYTWHITSEENPYVRATVKISKNKYKYIQLHRFILNLKSRKEVGDHINHNKLDNRRKNLRKCSYSENRKNSIGFGASKYLGVCKSTGRNKWQATIKANGKYKMLGRFDTEESAAKCYDIASKKYHGEFANLNFR